MPLTYKTYLRYLRAAGVAAVCTAVAACVPETRSWSPAEAPKVNKVDFIRLDHAVAFAGRSASLTATEREKLVRFLASIHVQSTDQIMISTPGVKTGTGRARLAGRREAAVSEFLRSRNIRAGLLPANTTPLGESAPPWQGGVTLVVGRYIVTPPNCPNLTKPSGSDSGNRPSSNIGCATTANLGLMLADPGDLIRTRQISPGDAEFLARGVKSYQAGEAPPPPVLIPLVKSGSEE